MGSGKSSVGRRLASALTRVFYDCDKEIESVTGVSITTIFDLEGEEGFRRREQLALRELCAHPNSVLATGGGVVLSPENRRLMSAQGILVYLKTSLPVLLRRTHKDTTRPLLQTADPVGKMAEILAVREPLYEQLADYTVDTSLVTVTEIVERIVADLARIEKTPSLPSD